MRRSPFGAAFALAAVVGLAGIPAQQPVQLPPQTPMPKPREIPPSAPPPVAKLGPNLYRLGEIQVDTAKREASVAGTVNAVTTLEFVANTRGGAKAYESALTLDTHGVVFNAAMLLIGLDRAHARVPTQHFDPAPPQGDRVSLWIDWTRHGEKTRTPVEQLLFDQETHQPVPASEWVYTGSVFVPEAPAVFGTKYLADLDGVLIGFVHSPAPIIENVAGAGVKRYGLIVLNPNLGLEPDTPVTLTVKALGPALKPH
jgi:hypothetical protein